MSTENVEVFNRYYGNGVATQFSIGFPYLKREFVKVYLYKKDTDEEKVLNSDQFSFVNDATIQYPVLPTDEILKEGDIITIQRETELGSEFEFDNQRRLFPVEVMNADDLAFQQIQELSREIKRAVRVNPTAAQQPEELLTEVYDKLDSATEVAEQAIGAANQATTAAKDAKDAVVVAQQQITETQAFIEQARADINQTVEESIEYVEQEAVKAATEVVSEVVGQYTDRAETAAKNAEADALRTAESASQASASATSAAASASEVSVYNFKNKITNCITEIPQDIKLELNNGTLTLNVGSKVYVPNGKDSNGANVFKEINILNAKTLSGQQGSANSKILLALNSSNVMFPRSLSASVSGSGVSSIGGYSYDTNTNIMNWYNNSGELAGNNCSLPIAILTTNSEGVISSIDQVFNGFGYIGSTVFALPNVKGLIPNGRNADGSLKNIEFTVDKVSTVQAGSTSAGYIGFVNGTLMRRYSGNSVYDESKNIWYNPETGNFFQFLYCGDFSEVSARITSFQPKLPFRAADDQEIVKISGNQTIDGEKNFLKPVAQVRGDVDVTVIYARDTGADTTKAPTGSIRRRAFRVIDVNGKMLGDFRTERTTDGRQISSINARNGISGSEVNGVISVSVDASGGVYTYAPTPAVSDNSTKIATTNYVNQKIQLVSALPANRDANIYYCIPE